MGLTRSDIVAGLRNLGVEPGMVVMVHSALAAFGEVEGGADTVIEALIEALGPEGTLLMPAMGGAPIFDVETTPSNVGEITDRFWRREDVTRSIHPTHSAAGRGPLVFSLLSGHLDQPTAIGPDSPWGRVAALANGHLLFLGCDQDRNTLLHTAEDLVDGAYLKTLRRDYYDEERNVRTLVMERFPGPHRDFIQLDRVFREAGAMRVGKIGNAVCRLMKAGQTLELAVAALRRDPAAVLCDNPHCVDCVQQRAAIRRARLATEDFTLGALVDDVSPLERLADLLWEVQAEGLDTLEVSARFAATLAAEGEGAVGSLTERLAAAGCSVAVWPVTVPWEHDAGARRAALTAAAVQAAPLAPRYLKLSPWLVRDADLATALPRAVEALQELAEHAAATGLTLLIENHPAAVWRSRDTTAQVLLGLDHPAVRLSFNPAHFAQIGEHPFLSTWNRGKLKRFTAQLMVADGCGRPGWPSVTLPGRGQGEVKELISILRCRSFDGLLTISTGGAKEFGLPEAAGAFWRLLDTM